jgi:molybdopterin molybdotransferase
MMDFFEARRQVLAAAERLEAEWVSLSQASGRVLAESLFAAAPLPAFDYSAMDGYALRSSDVNGSPPWELPVTGECRAGGTPGPLGPGQALRIFTGAPLPSGADSVLIQEEVTRAGERICFEVRVEPYANVRRAGEDLKAGALGLEAGTRLGPFQLGLAAALDREQLLVSRRPRVVVVPTGDELRPPGSAGPPGTIPESNGVALTALAVASGAEARLVPHLSDDAAASTRALAALLASCDVLVTVGGVSVGEHDVVRPALLAAGAQLEFWKVAIKPGKPLTFGRAGRTLVLGLPGNPVSAQLTFALFGVPLLRALQGDRSALPPSRRVLLAQPLTQKPGRLGIYRARLEGAHAVVHENQASGSSVSLAHADLLVFVPADRAHCPANSEVEAISLAQL